MYQHQRNATWMDCLDLGDNEWILNHQPKEQCKTFQ